MSSPIHAQVDCWAPRDPQNSVATARFTPSFSEAELNAPAVRADKSGDGRRRLDSKITVNFWSKSNSKDDSPRTKWLRAAKETFDVAAVAALLR